MNVRVATPDDLDDVVALLDTCRLPVVGVPGDLAALYVGTTDDRRTRPRGTPRVSEPSGCFR
jgi:hypothetical protein